MIHVRIIPAILLTLPVLGAPEQPAARPEPPAALVCLLEHKATVAEPSRKSRDLALFDWLPAGSTVSTLEGARLVLIFSNGARWEMGGKSQSRIEKSGLTGPKGDVRKLEPVPMIPAMTQVRAAGKPGAFTVRGGETDAFTALSPGEGESVLAEDAGLRFQPPPPAGRFRVEIEDESGNSIFSVETLKTEVRVSPGILKPGLLYFWRVRTLDGPKPAVSAETSFRTVPENHATIRAALKAESDKNPDPALRSLLTEMDRWLGLKR